jgi:hypothetical protein
MKFNKYYFIESSLSRIWQYVEQNKPFGVISAFRQELSEKENEQRHIDLKKDIRNSGLGFIELEGGWTEEGVFNAEKSLFVPNIQENKIVELGQKYDQYSVLYNDGKSFVMIGTNKNSGVGKVLSQFNIGKGKENITLAKDAVKDFYSALMKGSHAGKKFLFKLKERECISLNRLAYSNESIKWFEI